MGKVIRPFCWHQNSVPKGLSTPALRLYTCGKTKKICTKSELKGIFLKLTTNGQSDKAFLLASNFWPQGVFCPCPRAVYMYKIIKNVYEIRFRRDHFETCNMGKEKRPFCCHQNFVSKGLSAPALGLYTCIKALKYIPGPGVRWAFTGPLVLWFSFPSDLLLQSYSPFLTFPL